MNTQNKEPPPEQPAPTRRKFGWFGLRDKLRTFKQMYQFHSTLDVEKALRVELWKGMRIDKHRRIPVEPYCDLHNDPEFDQPLVCIAPGIFVCQLCRTLTSIPVPVARPTVNLGLKWTKEEHREIRDVYPDVERTTGPIHQERPVFANAQKWHPDEDAGTNTQQVRAIRRREAGKLGLEDIPTIELKGGKHRE